MLLALRKVHFFIFIFSTMLFVSCRAASAKSLFHISVNVTTPTFAQGAESANTITALVNKLSDQNLNTIVGAYTNTSAANAILNIRGLTAFASFPSDSTSLHFSVPQAGVNVTFTGTTRNDSEQQLLDFLIKNGGNLATKVLQALVAASPVDPVAGNPGSLQNSMAFESFSIGTGIGVNSPPTSVEGPHGVLVRQPDLVQVGGDVGTLSAGGYRSTVVTLPIRYNLPFSNPRWALTIDAPITYVNTQGDASYYGSLGVSLRAPVLRHWYLTPSIRVGAAGSLDLGAAAFEYAAGLASRYDIYFHDLMITIGNGVSVVHTTDLSVGNVHVNYDLSNQLWNNGVQVVGSLPLHLFGDSTSWQAFVVDTYVTGSKVYVDHYDQIGFTVGTRSHLNTQDWNAFRVGVEVTIGSHFNAYKIALTYRF